MKFFANLALIGLFCLAVKGQTILPPEYPFNPDSDGDEFVAVSDVLMSVASYDNDFQASPIMVDSLTIEQAMQLMLQKLDSLLAGSSVTNPGDNGNPGTDPDGNTDTSDSTWTCGDPVMYWGFEYGTYAFGDQCWFQDNLRTSQYSNGDSITILSTTPPGEDLELVTDGAAFISTNITDENLSFNSFGLMYNWYAVGDARNICPAGWHVPVYAEWEVLSGAISLGTLSDGELLLDATFYPFSGLPFSTDGFLFTPGGYYPNNTANGYSVTQYWTGTFQGGYTALAFYIFASSNSLSISPLAENIWSGMGVRCIQDSE